MSEPEARTQLRSFVERIERLEEEIKAINGDKSEVYAEAKGNGFDVKVLRAIVSDRRKDRNELLEFEALYDLYAAELGMPVATRARARLAEPEPIKAQAGGQGVGAQSTSPALSGNHTGEDAPSSTGLASADEASLASSATIPSESNEGQSLSETTDGAREDGVASRLSAGSGSGAPFTSKPLRPYCQRPEQCGGYGRQHCGRCDRERVATTVPA